MSQINRAVAGTAEQISERLEHAQRALKDLKKRMANDPEPWRSPELSREIQDRELMIKYLEAALSIRRITDAGTQ